jgi:hypothetical protein
MEKERKKERKLGGQDQVFIIFQWLKAAANKGGGRQTTNAFAQVIAGDLIIDSGLIKKAT